MPDDPKISIVLVTAPVDVAEGLSGRLLKMRLIACANLIGPVRSVYVWEGETQAEEEMLMVLKTPKHKVAALTEAVSELHPYDVPEVLEVDVASGLSAYLAWVDTAVE